MHVGQNWSLHEILTNLNQFPPIPHILFSWGREYPLVFLVCLFFYFFSPILFSQLPRPWPFAELDQPMSMASLIRNKPFPALQAGPIAYFVISFNYSKQCFFFLILPLIHPINPSLGLPTPCCFDLAGRPPPDARN